MRPFLYWRITDKCNLQCRHCCYSCGPSGESVSIEDAKRIINNFPKNIRTIEITGGEPMVVKPLLEEILLYMQAKKFEGLKVILQTNGFWVKDEETTYKQLAWLSELGVRGIDITSDDKYHREQGIDPNMLRPDSIRDEFAGRSAFAGALRRLTYEFGDQAITDTYFRGVVRIDPFGRGKNFQKEELFHRSCFIPGCLKEQSENLNIDPSGNVYPCCYQMPYFIGNAIDTPLEIIAENARQDRILSLLNEEGLWGVAQKFGIALQGYGSCNNCEEVFAKLKEMQTSGANAPRLVEVSS
jgi:MoaA/NifB/PqqE/SkfB family radical SAM enzyme